MTSGTLGLTKALGEDISQEELDFSDLFLYNPPDDFPAEDDKGALPQDGNHQCSLGLPHPCDEISTYNPPVSSQLSPSSSSSHGPATDHLSSDGPRFDSLGLTSRPGVIPAPSPRIEITPSGDSHRSQPLEPSSSSTALGAYREQPCVSPASSNSSTGWPAEAYSPQASPCVSPVGGGGGAVLSALDLCPSLQGIHTSSTHSSPGMSPRTSITEETFLLLQHQRTTSPHPHQRSRSASPQGKRAYDQYCSPNLGGTPVKLRSRSPSPIPSPHDHQGSNVLHHYLAQAEPQPQDQTQSSSTCLEEMLNSLTSSLPRAVPSKIVQASEEGCVYGQAQRQDCLYGEGQGWAIEQDGRGRFRAEAKTETVYILPTVWPPPHLSHHGAFSDHPLTTLPSLEWPLPSQSDQYQLLIQQQPRSHHRAHYETEGSRGAVKTPNGGHPEVQLRGYRGTAPLGLQVFIGTADERVMKPHAFYHVHRITGKTVTTPSLERMVSGTKVLEIPLEPKNHMRAMIDCAGILKLRNADIELRNGETDIGRKNTRVRFVFRVHIPQPGGQLVSLQVASDPIECSQRSAQELPTVERHDLGRCSVLGGQRMVLTGQNFTSDSKVLFSEKTHDGQQIWEVEATVDRDKSQPSMLFVEVPPYRDPTIYHPAKVNFYVINGKKKRSQPQHFTYTPLIVPVIKAEPVDDYQFGSFSSTNSQSLGLSAKSLYHHLDQDSHALATNISLTPYHMASLNPGAHGLTSHFLEDQLVYNPPRSSTLSTSPMLYQAANQHHGHPGAAVLSGSPAQRQIAGLQQSHYPTLVSHISTTSASSHCVGIGVGYQSEVTLSQVSASLDACSVPRHQGYVQMVVPLGRSPPSTYTQGQAHGTPGSREQPVGQALTQKGPVTDGHGELVPEKVTVKQENLNQAYLEDVNDIIRRDLKVHSGEQV